jgi:hypothetical protein
VRFVIEPGGAIRGLAKEALVVLAITFVGDLETRLKERRKEVG